MKNIKIYNKNGEYYYLVYFPHTGENFGLAKFVISKEEDRYWYFANDNFFTTDRIDCMLFSNKENAIRRFRKNSNERIYHYNLHRNDIFHKAYLKIKNGL